MSLEPGTYIITSPALEDSVIARSTREDLSLLPKKVVSIAKSATEPALSTWVVAKVDDRYKLIVKGYPTAPLDDKLFAILSEEPPAEEWIVTYRKNHEAYTIETSSRERGWVVPLPDSEDNQVLVQGLITGQSLPPYFPATELFKFIKVD
ncbi:proteinase inhibitor [Phlebopus sp. FC_14]|nr:proteinase inhibitor [Phlebopus sp. FC_14]